MSEAKSVVAAEAAKVNGGMPWMQFGGEAGTKEYAEQCSEFFAEAFGGEWVIESTEEGWWYSAPANRNDGEADE